MEEIIVTSSRLQPIHRDHVAFWERLHRDSEKHLVVCVLRDIPRDSAARAVDDAETYEEYTNWTRKAENNPLPDWHRLRLAELAVSNNPALAGSTTVMFRERPDLEWAASLTDLPETRTWAFNVTKSDFDATKPDFYESKGESVERVEFGKPGGYEGRAIRRRLRSGDRDLDFLPEGCRNYFTDHCIRYFEDDKI